MDRATRRSRREHPSCRKVISVTEEIRIRTFSNGLTLIAHPVPGANTAAFTLLLPAGCAYEPADRAGLAAMTGEMMMRGAGPRDSRQLIIDLDLLGIDHGGSVSQGLSQFHAAMRSNELEAAMEIFADIVRRPHLPEDELEATRLGALQEVRAVEDNPHQKTKQELRRQSLSEPWNRPANGTEQGLEAVTIDDIRRFHQRCYGPHGAIIAVAGPQTASEVEAIVERYWSDWNGVPPERIGPQKFRTGGMTHVEHTSEQTHLAVAWSSVSYSHEQCAAALAAMDILGGGLSSRLFTEVRERLGLCYSVYAALLPMRQCGLAFCYSATTTERAQTTLDMLARELARLSQGVTADELARAKARAKTALVMQRESCLALSSQLAYQWHLQGRIQTLTELREEVDRLDEQAIQRHLNDFPPRPATIVTLGPCALEMPDGIH